MLLGVVALACAAARPAAGAPKRARGGAPSCGWASGCCQRHPYSCRDATHLRLAPADACAGSAAARGQCCVGTPVYTRVGKTGSKNTTLFFAAPAAAGCAQWGLFHDVTADGASATALPAHQAKVSVIREPCSRARSLLRHWHSMMPAGHPVRRVTTLAALAAFLRAQWANVTARPWPEADAARHHYIVGWPQSWYVDACTRVLCFERLEAELRGFCPRAAGPARRPGAPRRAPAGGGATAAAVGGATSAAAGAEARACAEIRALYADDAAMHDRHCAGKA